MKSLSFPKALRSKLPWSCGGQCTQAGCAATGWDLFLLVKGDSLPAIFHHHLVLNPSKSVSLWQHMCASSYRGLWQANSLSASVALLQRGRAPSLCISFPMLICSDSETANNTDKTEKQHCWFNASYLCGPLVWPSLVTMSCFDE